MRAAFFIAAAALCGCQDRPQRILPAWATREFQASEVTLELRAARPGDKPVGPILHVSQDWLNRFSQALKESLREDVPMAACAFHPDVILHASGRTPVDIGICFGCGEIGAGRGELTDVLQVSGLGTLRPLMQEALPNESRFRE